MAAGISSTKQVYPPSFAGSKTAVSFTLSDYHADCLPGKRQPPKAPKASEPETNDQQN
jgi:hypothetical protein